MLINLATIMRSNKLTLNHTLNPVPRPPQPQNLEPAPSLQQRPPLLLGPLARAEKTHHVLIEVRRLITRVHGGDHMLVHQQLAIPGRHGLPDRPNDLLAPVVGPVVQDVMQVVGASALDGLRREKVVRHELDPVEGGDVRGDRVQDGLHVLQDQAAGGGGEHLREALDVVADGAAYVDQHRVALARAVAVDEPGRDGVDGRVHPGDDA